MKAVASSIFVGIVATLVLLGCFVLPTTASGSAITPTVYPVPRGSSLDVACLGVLSVALQPQGAHLDCRAPSTVARIATVTNATASTENATVDRGRARRDRDPVDPSRRCGSGAS